MERMTPEEYNDKCWDKVDSYIKGIQSEEIIAGTYIKKAVEKFVSIVNNPLYDYRVDKVDKVFKFFSFLNVDHHDKYVQFPLMDWQCFYLAAIFGFYEKGTDKRKHRESLLFIGRKNGKTAFSAAIQMFGMLGDGVSVPQSLLLSNTSKQASNALNYAKDMLTHTPALRSRLLGQRNRIIFSDNKRQGFCEIFSTVEPARLEGFSPSMCILDEIHGFTNGDIFNAIKTGIGARQNPLLLLITTAGNRNASFCNDYLTYHKNVLDNKIEDSTVFSLIYQPDPTDDLKDVECWYKANPSLGVINTLEDLKKTFNQAQYSYVDKFNFITKHLNIFFDTPDVWIPEEDIVPSFKNMILEDYKNRDCFIGMDLSSNTDLTSIVLLFPPTDEDKYHTVFPLFYMANRPGNFVRKNGKDLSYWIRQGHIIKCDGKVINLDQIYEKIVELSQEFNIISITYDKYNTPQLVSRLQEQGINCINFEQTTKRFNAPLKILESFIYEDKIRFFNNPCMLWNFANVVLYIDSNNNIKVMKNKQNDSVDGIVALGMAFGGFIETTYGIELIGLKQYMNVNL
jgi:phage terminase large subunit-like protein